MHFRYRFGRAQARYIAHLLAQVERVTVDHALPCDPDPASDRAAASAQTMSNK
ncbi:hypothetical protein [Paraburkholderia unamae]|uniref:hypothetical protein n=1 Tax=Paraburkholderia unamae TaxID=219649 RepID=UPI0014028050|nr:hypothetical protein [Paraburkholderia unamae]